MGSKHKETKKSKRDNEGNGLGETEAERTSKEEKRVERTNNRKTTRKDVPKKGQHKNINGKRKRNKKERIDKPKIDVLDQKKKEEEKEIKGKIRRAVEAWQACYEGGEEGTEEEEKKEREVMNTIKNAEVVGHAVIETYIRKGLEAQKRETTEETYTIRDYTILDVNWGQYTEKRPGEIYKGRENGHSHQNGHHFFSITQRNDGKEQEIHNGYTLQLSLVICSHR